MLAGWFNKAAWGMAQKFLLFSTRNKKQETNAIISDVYLNARNEAVSRCRKLLKGTKYALLKYVI